MIAERPSSGETEPEGGGAGSSARPVSTLRGAGVEVDARRVGRVVAGVCMAALAVTAAVLFVAGADKNAQIIRLRHHGVRVEVTVTKCIGLLGGSGSNAAGYACRGSFTVGGRHYDEAIPGNTLLAPGATVRGVADPDDPALVSTAAAVAQEHPSWRVFILPSVLTVILAFSAVAVILGRRHRRRTL